MHFFYIDESGCTGPNLADKSQPVFVLGGISVRDEGWNETHREFLDIIHNYFSEKVPASFELHACKLLTRNGDDVFFGHDLKKRLRLVEDILSLLKKRKHGVHYIAIDKQKLQSHAPIPKISFDASIPYLLAYDYLITYINTLIKKSLGKSARGMLIIDDKEAFYDDVFSISRSRRDDGPVTHRIKHIVEFTHPMDSGKNTMIQISDLVVFCVRKFLEIDSNNVSPPPPVVIEFYAKCFDMIYPQMKTKGVISRGGHDLKPLNKCLTEVQILPSRSWRTKHGLS